MRAQHYKQLDVYKVERSNSPLKFSPYYQPKFLQKNSYNQKIFKKGPHYTFKNGQRKLLISEIYFFNEFYKKDTPQICVYVGAADGKHINLLLKLYPNISFELYDPRDFMIKESNRVKIFQQFFQDDDALQYKGKDVLFISDIRLMEQYTDKNQDVVEEDMQRQKKWIEMIIPTAWMLKMKLNYYKKFQDYLDGKIWLQPWTNPWSIETRLIGTNIREKKYNCEDYEQKLFFFNIYKRYQIYEQKYENNPEKYCGCYDCTQEINTLQDYLKLEITDIKMDDLQKEIIKYQIQDHDINFIK